MDKSVSSKTMSTTNQEREQQAISNKEGTADQQNENEISFSTSAASSTLSFSSSSSSCSSTCDDNLGVELPAEMLMEVMRWLPSVDVARCSAVCRRWNAASTDPAMWKQRLNELGLAHIPARRRVDWAQFHQRKRSWCWNSKSAHPLVKLSDNNLAFSIHKRRPEGTSYLSALGAVRWVSGRHFWQVKVEGTSAEWSEIGVADRNHWVEGNHWNYRGLFAKANDTQLTGDAKRTVQMSGTRVAGYSVGDVIGMVLDLDEMWVRWYVNGREILRMEEMKEGVYSPFALVCNAHTTFRIVSWNPFPLGNLLSAASS